MTKYEIELSDNTVSRLRKIAEAINDGFLRNSLLSGERAAILEIARQLPSPALPDGVYAYRGKTHLSTYFVKDGKHSGIMDTETGLLTFAVDVTPSGTENWTRIGDLPDLENNG